MPIDTKRKQKRLYVAWVIIGTLMILSMLLFTVIPLFY